MKTTIFFGFLFLVCCSQQITEYPTYSDSDEGCGIIRETLAANDVGVAGENKIWPWINGILDFSNNPKQNWKFRCTGLVFTRKYILTDASCALTNGKEAKQGTLLVTIRNLIFDIKKIRIDRDRGLAFLVLKNPIEPSSKEHRPICLWEGQKELKKIMVHKGFVSQDYKTERYYIRELVRRIFFVGKGRQIFNPKAYAMFLDMQELQRRLKGRGDSGGDLRV